MLGTLPEKALINQSGLLTHFLFFEDDVVQKEAQKLIKRLSGEEKVLLKKFWRRLLKIFQIYKMTIVEITKFLPGGGSNYS